MRVFVIEFSLLEDLVLKEKLGKVWQIDASLTDFCPLGCYRPIKNVNRYAKFSQKNTYFKVKR